MTEAQYVTRDALESALDVKPSAYMAQQLDRACRAGSRMVESFCHRIFYPVQATRTFDYPGQKLWLDDQELISLSELSSDGTVIPSTDYFLRPDIGPPFDRIEIDQDSSSSFAGGPQRAISATGLWASAPNTEALMTTLDAAISSTTATTIDVNAPAGGVGAILRIGSERMLVLGKSWVTSAQTAPALALSAGAQSMAVSNGAVFTTHEYLLIDSERVQVLEIAGNTLTIRRAVGGSTLAAHTIGATIYWQHRLTVERGALGTTAATASDEAAVYRWIPPSPVEALAQAYAEDMFLQENAGYARTSGQGENERPTTGTGIAALEKRVSGIYRRKVRTRAI